MARAAGANSFVILIAALFSGSALADKYFIANLDGTQEVPPNASSATGFGRVILNDSRDQVRISLDFSGLASNQTAAHIHSPGGFGVNAPVLINIGSSGLTSGTFNLTAPVSATEVADLERGLWYFNVHSVDLPGGEIRGQVLADLPFEAVLDGVQEVPPNLGAAIGYGTVSLNDAGNRIAVDLRYAGLSAAMTAAHIHGPAPAGTNAPVLFDLGVPGGTAGRLGDLFFTVTSTQADALRAGELYFNIHTSTLPGGEIRGQILPAPRATSFMAPLRGNEEVPPNASSATGLGVIELLSGDTAALISVYWNGVTSGVVAGHIHAPAPVGVNAPVLFDLAASGGASGEVVNFITPVTPAQVADLRQGHWYFNLHSPDFPGGEIRGQVFPAWPHRAFMEGGQEVPANASTALGLGAVLRTPAADQIVALYLFGGLSAPATAGHIHHGVIGVNGPILFDVQPPALISGGIGHRRFDLAPGQAELLRDGDLYYNLHNGAFPAGEVRGQLHAYDLIYVSAFD